MLRQIFGKRRVEPVPAPPEPEVAPQPVGITFTGDYASYEAALADCGGDPGYSGEAAVERYVRRYKEVVADPASIIRGASDPMTRIMAAFSLAEPIDGVFRVLDFGGGYASIFHLLRHLHPERRFDWRVVELPETVARGAEMGASDQLHFATEVPDGPFSIAILSGTLQYLPDPRARFAALSQIDTPLLFINRLPIAPWLERDRLTVQRVPASLFEAAFPAWFLAPSFRDEIAKAGDIIMQWDAPGDITQLDGQELRYQAMIVRR